jgi:hypothetical protein
MATRPPTEGGPPANPGLRPAPRRPTAPTKTNAKPVPPKPTTTPPQYHDRSPEKEH